METETRNEGQVETSLQNHKSVFSGASTYLTFTVVFVILLQYYSKSNKSSKKNKSNKKGESGDEDEYLGYDDLPGPKALIPSPFDIIGVAPQLLPLSNALKVGEKWSNEYGDFFKASGLGQKFVVFNSGPVLQTLLKSSDFGHVTKAPIIYDPMKPFVDNGVLVSRDKFWQGQRKTLMKSQNFQSLKAYLPMVNKHCRDFVEQLEMLFSDGKPHTINGPINTTFLRIINEMLTGQDVENLEEFEKYHHNFNVWKEALVKRIFNPWLLVKPIWMLHPMSKPYNQAVGEMFEFARRRIKEHKGRRVEQERKQKVDDDNHSANDNSTSTGKPLFRCVLDELLDAGVNERQTIDEINTMLFGGHETGAGAIHCLCFALALNQEIQEEARQEVDKLYGDPTQFKNGTLTYDTVQTNLKYLERCILETLRLFPPVFMFARKLLTPLKVEHDGKTYVIPTGTNALVVPFVLHRREEYYPDPHKFDPDRFLPEVASERHAYSYIPFSGGPRNCLGLKFAMVEMKVIMAYLLRNFEITTTDRMEDIPLMPHTTLTPERDYTFFFKKRTLVWSFK